MKKKAKVLRKARSAAQPAVDTTRAAARAVFEQIKAAHAKAAKALKEGAPR